MKSRKFKSETVLTLLCALAVFSTMGCTKVFNPYDSQFQCPNTYKGKCVSVQNAYHDSVTGKAPDKQENKQKNDIQNTDEDCDYENDCWKLVKTKKSKEDKESKKDPAEKARYNYLQKKYEKLSALIGNPAVPMVVPPEVVRVLVLSYTGDDNELFGYRYVYFFATGPTWSMSTGKGGTN